MSHNIVLRDVKFKDLSVLGKIVNNISNGQCQVVKSDTFRTFMGQSDKCAAKIVMPGNYDIGLLKSKDGYTPVADFSMIRENPLAGGYAPLGKVQQEYTLQEAEYKAAQSGMTASRNLQKDGTVILELVQAS
jgi:hypothetical protein